ncbi:hypothetical protein PVAP13_3NG179957 [Panicum virgatum]|uniref:Endonuclease/exonuclease/phosphatase domain-containing protein n=1 Tax=Panicum virgatum TaxID=38727 RepID=A0A8T0U8G8_PANVG|nr:hypothetical protein PVAP13_3NG179957 [Panicum virgatum]
MDICKEHNLDFIGIQETKSESFSATYLSSLAGNKHFCWKWLPARGTAGGILMGVDADNFDIVDWSVNTFSVSCKVMNKKDGFGSMITTVYGPVYDDKKEDFLLELRSICDNCEGPHIIGGDFNLVRSALDKSNGAVDQNWCDKFNLWIDECNLVELHLMGRKFT